MLPQPPEGGSVPRPSEAPAEAEDRPTQNGHADWTPAERRMLLAAEEYRAAKIALTGSDEPPLLDLAPQWARVLRKLDDLDGLAKGPQPQTMPAMEAPLEPDNWLVGNFIRPGTTVMLTGPPGSSKSWAARQLAMACSGGLSTFLNQYPIERPMNVLVVDEDNGPKEEWRRDGTLLAHLGLQRGQLGSLRRLSLEGVQLDQEVWQAWLRSQIEGHALDLVILDPISEMHGGKELREDPAFRSLLRFLKVLKVDFPGLATLLVHHTRKLMSNDRGKERGLDDVRGQWGQTPDVVALLWPLGEWRAAWELHKRVPHSKLILEATEGGPLVTVADETSAVTKTLSTDHRVMAAIEAGAEDWDQIMHATGMSKSGIFKVIGRLRTAGIVTKQAPYQLVGD